MAAAASSGAVVLIQQALMAITESEFVQAGLAGAKPAQGCRLQICQECQELPGASDQEIELLRAAEAHTAAAARQSRQLRLELYRCGCVMLG